MQIQMLRERLAEAERESKAHGDIWLGESRWRTAYEVLEMLKLLDLPIIDGVGLVAADLEAGIDATKASAQYVWFDDAGEQHFDYESYLTAILAACNIIVPDEIHKGEFEDEGYGDHWLSPEARNLSEWCESGQQYTITITRERKETHGQQETKDSSE